MPFDFLTKTPVEQVASVASQVITLDSNTLVPSALKILSEKNIYSAPVVESGTGKFLGWIDLMDIVAFIVKIVEDSEKQRKGKEIDFYALLAQDAKFSLEHSGAIADLSKNNLFLPIPKGSPLIEAIKILGTHRAHRVPIFEGNKIVSILTQTAVIQFLDHHKPNMRGLETKSIQELGIGKKDVVCVTQDQLALDAFEKMVENRISAVAIVDERGKLVTAITAKDVRTVSKHILFTSLYQTTLDFVSECRRQNLFTFSPAITCHPEDTLGTVIAKLAATRIHRLFVVDRDMRPIGVVSLSDILELILHPHVSKYFH